MVEQPNAIALLALRRDEVERGFDREGVALPQPAGRGRVHAGVDDGPVTNALARPADVGGQRPERAVEDELARFPLHAAVGDIEGGIPIRKGRRRTVKLVVEDDIVAASEREFVNGELVARAVIALHR